MKPADYMGLVLSRTFQIVDGHARGGKGMPSTLTASCVLSCAEQPELNPYILKYQEKIRQRLRYVHSFSRRLFQKSG